MCLLYVFENYRYQSWRYYTTPITLSSTKGRFSLCVYWFYLYSDIGSESTKFHSSDVKLKKLSVENEIRKHS